MKIEKISSDRLQITLTSDDLSEENVDFKKLCENRDDLNHFITLLLIKAKADTDFDLLNGQFIIRVLQSDTELVLTIIRISSPEDNPAKTPVNKNTKYKLVEQKEKTPIHHTILIKFAVIDDAKAFVSNIIDYIDEKAILYNDNQQYYLYLSPQPEHLSHLFVTATEFGEIFKDDIVRKALLDGHDKVLATGKDILSVMSLI